MGSLMRAAFVRYLSDSFMQLALIGAPVLGCFAVLTSNIGMIGMEIQPVWFALILMLCALLTALAVGREFRDGTIRNKLIVGHAKAKVFCAELFAAECITLMTYILSALPFYLATGEYRLEMKTSWQVRIYLLLLIVYLVFTALTVSLSFATGSSVWAVLGVFGIMALMYAVSSAQEEIIRMSDPETRYHTEYIYDPETGGYTEIQQVRIDFVELPDYSRKSIIWLNHCNTISSLSHFTGYFNEYGQYRGGSTEENAKWEKLRENAVNMVTGDIPPQLTIFILLPLAACMYFRKKDLQ